MISEYYPEKQFSESPVKIPSVNPERTFLEKILLLHEEFQKPQDKIRIDLLSRHLYDIERMMHTEYAEIALKDALLYNEIVRHRSKYSALKGINYADHTPF